MSFREAYREVGRTVEAGEFEFEGFDEQRYTHEGSIGNLCTDAIRGQMQKVLEKFS